MADWPASQAANSDLAIIQKGWLQSVRTYPGQLGSNRCQRLKNNDKVAAILYKL